MPLTQVASGACQATASPERQGDKAQERLGALGQPNLGEPRCPSEAAAATTMDALRTLTREVKDSFASQTSVLGLTDPFGKDW